MRKTQFLLSSFSINRHAPRIFKTRACTGYNCCGMANAHRAANCHVIRARLCINYFCTKSLTPVGRAIHSPLALVKCGAQRANTLFRHRHPATSLYCMCRLQSRVDNQFIKSCIVIYQSITIKYRVRSVMYEIYNSKSRVCIVTYEITNKKSRVCIVIF